MRLIGGRDYYDYGLSFGRDETVTFVRKKSCIENAEQRDRYSVPHPYYSAPGVSLRFQNNPLQVVAKSYDSYDVSAYKFSRKDWRISFHRVMAWIAGASYCGLIAYEMTTDHMRSNRVFLWTLEQLDGYVNRLGWMLDDSFRNYDTKKTCREEFVDYFALPIRPADRDWMIDNRHTIMIWVESGLHFDGAPGKDTTETDTDGLKNIQFVKRLDPVQAFQNISMWVSGVLPRPGPPMVEITDDKVKAHKHGMDKWSFRKMPQK